jgi:PTS system mannose-specific IIB component/fructoselysine and glucoselysine-specific PTS system IIB component
MSIVLFRVDERLIHGQVVIGWGSQLQPTRYLVVDDALADADWEQELYRLAVGNGAAVEFHSVEDARRRVAEWSANGERIVLLTRDLDTMLRLARGRLLAGKPVNVGGIHHAEGRSRVRSYLELDDADRGRERALEEDGVELFGRDLPGSLKVSLHDLLEEP